MSIKNKVLVAALGTLLLAVLIGTYADTLDIRLKEYEEARSKGREGYDPQVLADARAWAKDQYEQHFQSSPKLSAAPVVCGSI